MRIQLTPSYYLTDEIGETPRLVHRQSEQNYGPDDIAQLYPSWPLQPVLQSVRRAVKTMQLTAARRAAITSGFLIRLKQLFVSQPIQTLLFRSAFRHSLQLKAHGVCDFGS
jgi:hypothetical protein